MKLPEILFGSKGLNPKVSTMENCTQYTVKLKKVGHQVIYGMNSNLLKSLYSGDIFTPRHISTAALVPEILDTSGSFGKQLWSQPSLGFACLSPGTTSAPFHLASPLWVNTGPSAGTLRSALNLY